jgi:lysozyme
MRRLAGLALAAVLSACSTVDYDFGDVAPSASAPATTAVATRHPRFGDRDPHEWGRRAPWTYAVHGTDVSKYQKSVDWHAAKASGISFAFIKATEGGDRVDERFLQHWHGARAAGVPRSAYHFYYFCRPAAEQAAWFIRNVPRDASALPHVLDMEWNHMSPTCKLRPEPSVVRSEMRIFLEALTRHYGKKPIIYTSIDFFDDNGLRGFTGYDWWLRSVSAHPDERYGSHPFRFWQYTGTGEVPGIAGDADINVFNGSEAEWRAWLKAHTK